MYNFTRAGSIEWDLMVKAATIGKLKNQGYDSVPLGR
jgi:hypothetical protein